jgi:hypothetical protein
LGTILKWGEEDEKPGVLYFSFLLVCCTQSKILPQPLLLIGTSYY